jgi:hypothetical protein
MIRELARRQGDHRLATKKRAATDKVSPMMTTIGTKSKRDPPETRCESPRIPGGFTCSRGPEWVTFVRLVGRARIRRGRR